MPTETADVQMHKAMSSEGEGGPLGPDFVVGSCHNTYNHGRLSFMSLMLLPYLTSYTGALFLVMIIDCH